MKYKVGDKVRIKSIDWYNDNKNEYGIIGCGNANFIPDMKIYCGDTLTICDINEELSYYYVTECQYTFKDEMIEGLVEEETKPNITEEAKTYWDSIKDAWICPEGYIFKDENGNVINATKIVLEKKKKEYPKTYEECIGKLPINWDGKVEGYKCDLLTTFQKLLICRDAYWKLYGDEMGFDKPWELSIGTPIYYIYYNRTVGTIKNDYADDIQGNIIFAFPTKEMRDAFYENFKELINECKELL